MNQTDNRPRRRDYKIRGKRVWALAQGRYLAGGSARSVAEALGLTEYAIRKRISREGWSKRAVAEAEEAGVPDPPPDRGWSPASIMAEPVAATPGDEPLEPRAAARAALTAAARLMREGRMTAAGEAARVADVMGRAAARLEGDGPPDEGEPDEAAFEAVRRKVLGWDGEGESDPHYYRHPAAREARPEDPAARESATLPGAPDPTISPSAPLGPPVCAADAA